MTTAVELSLPFPPSVNRIWRSRRGHNGKPTFYLDRRYETWKRVCDNLLMATRPRPRVTGPFTISITLHEAKRRGDADNRVKAVLDWLQRGGVIENDSLADTVSISWGYAPEGCCVRIYPSEPARRRQMPLPLEAA